MMVSESELTRFGTVHRTSIFRPVKWAMAVIFAVRQVNLTVKVAPLYLAVIVIRLKVLFITRLNTDPPRQI